MADHARSAAVTDEEILREQFAAAEDAASWHRAMEIYDEGVVLFAGDQVGPAGGYALGRDAVGRWFAEWLSAFENISFDIQAIEPGSNGLAVHARHGARGKESGIELGTDIYYAYWFRMGKVIRVEVYADRDSAWRAAGVAG